MNVITKPILPVDIDETLIMHMKDEEIPEQDKVLVEDPLNPTKKIAFRINRPNLRCIFEEINNGMQVILWSRGKHTWAVNVAKALGLDRLGVIVCAKPTVYFDDKDVSEWLKDRVWLKPDMLYKDCNK